MIAIEAAVFAVIFVPALLFSCRVCAPIFAKMSQPRVVAEMALGIVIGICIALLRNGHGSLPTLDQFETDLNWLSFPALCVYMFCLGFETDLVRLKDSARPAITIAISALLVPFCATYTAILLGLPWTAGIASSWISNVAVSGALSVTAFPVMARILEELALLRSHVGSVALSAAAIDDIFSWTVLTILIGLANRTLTTAGTTICVLVMLISIGGSVVIWQMLARCDRSEFTRNARESKAILRLALLGFIVLPAVLARIDPVLIAFALGLASPRLRALRHCIAFIRPLAVALLPLFFVVSGLNASTISAVGLSSIILWTAWACMVKGGVSYVAAFASGFGHRRAAIIGSLMNCRGATSLIFLAVGLRYHLISSSTYSALLIIALITTLLGTPLIVLVEKSAGNNRDRSAELEHPVTSAAIPTWQIHA